MKVEGAWYARTGGKFQELYTIIHFPYTSMVLSYVLIGAVISRVIYADRIVLTLAAYFLGLGLSAHALNELHARHWGQALTRRDLQVLFVAPLVGALLIGAYGGFILYAASGSVLPPLVLLVLIFLETFFLFAYNIDLAGGKFHNDLSFAFSWAALPVLVSYYANALTISLDAVLVALAMAATAAIEINLSRWCKDYRRKSPVAEIRFADETKLRLSTSELIGKPEKSLKMIVVAVDLIAIGLFVHRLLP